MSSFLVLAKLPPSQIAQVSAADGNVLVWSDANQQWQPGAGGGGGGGLTSVGVTTGDATTALLVSFANTPLVANGTITMALASQAQNLVLASPNGSAGQPTMRALVAADIPTLPAGQISGLATVATSGSASDLGTGTLPTGRLSGSYAGLTGHGTLTAGVWNATAIGTQYGGTGQNFSASSGYIKLASGVASAAASIPTTDITGLATVATSGSAADLSTGTLPTGRLAGSYTGVTGVGTLAAGTWNATAVGTQYGGTGQNFSASSGFISLASGVASAVSTIGLAAGGTNANLSATGPGVLQQASSGANVTVGTVNLASTNFVTGVLPGANGGTNSSTLISSSTAGSVAYSTGAAGALAPTAAGSTSQVLIGGTTPTFGNVPLAAVAGGTAGQALSWNTATNWLLPYEPSLFGNGLDGAVTFDGSTTVLGLAPSSGVYTLTRDICCTDITITGATTQIATSGYRIYATGTLDISAAALTAGAIRWRTAANMNGGNAAGATGGTAPASLPSNTITTLPVGLVGTAGKSGGVGVGTAGTACTSGVWYGVNTASSGAGAGGASGTPNAGGALGGAGTPVNPTNNAATGSTGFRYLVTTPDLVKAVPITGGLSGATGGAGGGDGTNAGGGSGGSGSAAGMVYIAARTIARGTNSTVGLISALGGAPGTSANGVGGTAGGGGGSVGGSGGHVIIVCWNRTGSTITNAIDVTAGSGAAGGNGVSTGSGGGGGSANCSGRYFVYELSTNTCTSNVPTGSVAGSTASGATGGAGGVAATTRGNL